MKLLHLLLVALALLSPKTTEAADMFASRIQDLWYTGHRDEFHKMAQERLRANPNDIAGLFLKLNYEIAFAKKDELARTLERIEIIGNKITTPHLKEVWPSVQFNLGLVKEAMTQYTPEMVGRDITKVKQVEEDRKRGQKLPLKPYAIPMPFISAFEAAEKDGLIKP